MDSIVDEAGARIARRIKLERDARSWSLAELAERSGVSKATISKIEREAVSPTAVILVRLAAAFDLTLAGLLLRAEGEAGGVLGQPRPPPGGPPGTRLFQTAGGKPAPPPPGAGGGGPAGRG